MDDGLLTVSFENYPPASGGPQENFSFSYWIFGNCLDTNWGIVHKAIDNYSYRLGSATIPQPVLVAPNWPTRDLIEWKPSRFGYLKQVPLCGLVRYDLTYYNEALGEFTAELPSWMEIEYFDTRGAYFIKVYTNLEKDLGKYLFRFLPVMIDYPERQL